MWKKTQNIPYIIILFLAAVVIIQQCKSVNGTTETITSDTSSVTSTSMDRKIDTVWSVRDTFIYVNPKFTGELGPSPTPENMVPSEDYELLKAQYVDLLNKFLMRKRFVDTAYYDSSFVAVEDMVGSNDLMSRRYDFHVKYPRIKETNTITNTTTNTVTNTITKHPRQVLVGGGINGFSNRLINDVEIGILYKDRKDKLFGITGRMDMDGQPYLGFKMYTVIRLRKK